MVITPKAVACLLAQVAGVIHLIAAKGPGSLDRRRAHRSPLRVDSGFRGVRVPW